MTGGMRAGSTLMAVGAMVAIAFAQEGNPPGRQPGISQGSVTVIGCLKTADANSTTDASSTAGTTTNPAAYMLTGASLASSPAAWPRGGASGGGATATTGVASGGTSGTSTPAGPARGPGATTSSVYMLEGTSGTLQPHLNQQVQITGRLEVSAKTGATNESGHATQRLRVESVRVVAEACSVR